MKFLGLGLTLLSASAFAGQLQPGVIWLSPAQGPAIIRQCIAPAEHVDHYWIPSMANTSMLETQLQSYLNAHSGGFPSLKGWYRRYIGITLSGRKFVYAILTERPTNSTRRTSPHESPICGPDAFSLIAIFDDTTYTLYSIDLKGGTVVCACIHAAVPKPPLIQPLPFMPPLRRSLLPLRLENQENTERPPKNHAPP